MAAVAAVAAEEAGAAPAARGVPAAAAHQADKAAAESTAPGAGMVAPEGSAATAEAAAETAVAVAAMVCSDRKTRSVWCSVRRVPDAARAAACAARLSRAQARGVDAPWRRRRRGASDCDGEEALACRVGARQRTERRVTEGQRAGELAHAGGRHDLRSVNSALAVCVEAAVAVHREAIGGHIDGGDDKSGCRACEGESRC